MNSDQRIDSDWLKRLIRNGVLDSRDLKKAESVLGIRPSKKEWIELIDLYLLSLGAGFLICGIIFFFAYNWKDLHKFAKLGIVETLFVFFIALFFVQGKNSTVGKISLFLGSVTVGIFFAVFGQIYQTGADSYELFLIWTLLITIFALIGKDENLLFFWIFLVNLTLVLYWEKRVSSSLGNLEIVIFEILFLLNCISFGFWEFSHKKQILGIQRRWQSDIFGIFSIGFVTVVINLFIFEKNAHSVFYLISPVLYLAFLFLLFYYTIFLSQNLLLVACAFFSLIIVSLSVIVKFLNLHTHDFLLLSLIVMGEVALAVVILKKIRIFTRSLNK